MFEFDWTDHRRSFEERGWVHVRDGVAGAFVQHLRHSATAAAAATAALSGEGIRGEKAQHLIELPDGVCWDGAFDVVASLCGLDRAAIALSERHIKTYEADADPLPVPHKDRFASQVAVGISVEVPAGSHLVLYPDDGREVNPFLAPILRDSLEPDELPERALRSAREVVIHDQPGDVVVFRGSSMWHLRRHSAKTVVAYLKFNDFDCDPLGEDPETPRRRAATLETLSHADPTSVLASRPRLARQFESVSREHRRRGWPQFDFAKVWGRAPVPLSPLDVLLLHHLDETAGAETVPQLVDRHGDEAEARIRRLARRGAVDLLV